MCVCVCVCVRAHACLLVCVYVCACVRLDPLQEDALDVGRSFKCGFWERADAVALEVEEL